MDLLSIAAGAAGVGAAYVLYLVATKGLPAALAWLKAKWNAGKADLAALQGDVAGVQTKVASLETVVVAELRSRIAALEQLVAAGRVAPQSAVQPIPAAPAQAV
jgi:hypothetical protein